MNRSSPSTIRSHYDYYNTMSPSPTTNAATYYGNQSTSLFGDPVPPPSVDSLENLDSHLYGNIRRNNIRNSSIVKDFPKFNSFAQQDEFNSNSNSDIHILSGNVPETNYNQTGRVYSAFPRAEDSRVKDSTKVGSSSSRKKNTEYRNSVANRRRNRQSADITATSSKIPVSRNRQQHKNELEEEQIGSNDIHPAVDINANNESRTLSRGKETAMSIIPGSSSPDLQIDFGNRLSFQSEDTLVGFMTHRSELNENMDRNTPQRIFPQRVEPIHPHFSKRTSETAVAAILPSDPELDSETVIGYPTTSKKNMPPQRNSFSERTFIRSQSTESDISTINGASIQPIREPYSSITVLSKAPSNADIRSRPDTAMHRSHGDGSYMHMIPSRRSPELDIEAMAASRPRTPSDDDDESIRVKPIALSYESETTKKSANIYRMQKQEGKTKPIPQSPSSTTNTNSVFSVNYPMPMPEPKSVQHSNLWQKNEDELIHMIPSGPSFEEEESFMPLTSNNAQIANNSLKNQPRTPSPDIYAESLDAGGSSIMDATPPLHPDNNEEDNLIRMIPTRPSPESVGSDNSEISQQSKENDNMSRETTDLKTEFRDDDSVIRMIPSRASPPLKDESPTPTNERISEENSIMKIIPNRGSPLLRSSEKPKTANRNLPSRQNSLIRMIPTAPTTVPNIATSKTVKSAPKARNQKSSSIIRTTTSGQSSDISVPPRTTKSAAKSNLPRGRPPTRSIRKPSSNLDGDKSKSAEKLRERERSHSKKRTASDPSRDIRESFNSCKNITSETVIIPNRVFTSEPVRYERRKSHDSYSSNDWFQPANDYEEWSRIPRLRPCSKNVILINKQQNKEKSPLVALIQDSNESSASSDNKALRDAVKSNSITNDGLDSFSKRPKTAAIPKDDKDFSTPKRDLSPAILKTAITTGSDYRITEPRQRKKESFSVLTDKYNSTFRPDEARGASPMQSKYRLGASPSRKISQSAPKLRLPMIVSTSDDSPRPSVQFDMSSIPKRSSTSLGHSTPKGILQNKLDESSLGYSSKYRSYEALPQIPASIDSGKSVLLTPRKHNSSLELHDGVLEQHTAGFKIPNPTSREPGLLRVISLPDISPSRIPLKMKEAESMQDLHKHHSLRPGHWLGGSISNLNSHNMSNNEMMSEFERKSGRKSVFQYASHGSTLEERRRFLTIEDPDSYARSPRRILKPSSLSPIIGTPNREIPPNSISSSTGFKFPEASLKQRILVQMLREAEEEEIKYSSKSKQGIEARKLKQQILEQIRQEIENEELNKVRQLKDDFKRGNIKQQILQQMLLEAEQEELQKSSKSKKNPLAGNLKQQILEQMRIEAEIEEAEKRATPKRGIVVGNLKQQILEQMRKEAEEEETNKVSKPKKEIQVGNIKQQILEQMRKEAGEDTTQEAENKPKRRLEVSNLKQKILDQMLKEAAEQESEEQSKPKRGRTISPAKRQGQGQSKSRSNSPKKSTNLSRAINRAHTVLDMKSKNAGSGIQKEPPSAKKVLNNVRKEESSVKASVSAIRKLSNLQKGSNALKTTSSNLMKEPSAAKKVPSSLLKEASSMRKVTNYMKNNNGPKQDASPQKNMPRKVSNLRRMSGIIRNTAGFGGKAQKSNKNAQTSNKIAPTTNRNTSNLPKASTALKTANSFIRSSSNLSQKNGKESDSGRATPSIRAVGSMLRTSSNLSLKDKSKTLVRQASNLQKNTALSRNPSSLSLAGQGSTNSTKTDGSDKEGAAVTSIKSKMAGRLKKQTSALIMLRNAGSGLRRPIIEKQRLSDIENADARSVATDISESSGEKLVPLTKQNVVSMTTAAITSQPVEITTKVHNAVSRTKSQISITSNKTVSSTMTSVGEENAATILEKSQKTLENVQKTVSDAHEEIQKTISENLHNLKTMENDISKSDNLRTIVEKPSREPSTEDNGDHPSTGGKSRSSRLLGKESPSPSSQPIEANVSIRNPNASKNNFDGGSLMVGDTAEDMTERVSERAISVLPEVECESANLQNYEYSDDEANEAIPTMNTGTMSKISSADMTAKQSTKQQTDKNQTSGSQEYLDEEKVTGCCARSKCGRFCSRICMPCRRIRCLNCARCCTCGSPCSRCSKCCRPKDTEATAIATEINEKQSCWNSMKCCKSKKKSSSEFKEKMQKTTMASIKEEPEMANNMGSKQSKCRLCLNKFFCCRATNKVESMSEDVEAAWKCCFCIPCGRKKQQQRAWQEQTRRESIISEPRPKDGCCTRLMDKLRCWKRKTVESRRTSMNSKKHSIAPTNPPEDNRPKLHIDLIEYNSKIKGAIPVMPLWLAWFCMICNVFVPGLGTVLSGLFCLCVGIPRFSQYDSAKARIGSFIINCIIGAAQLFCVVFCFVGWGWSIWWGTIMLKTARKLKKIKRIEKLEIEEELRQSALKAKQEAEANQA